MKLHLPDWYVSWYGPEDEDIFLEHDDEGDSDYDDPESDVPYEQEKEYEELIDEY
jgi:hypothetical protein